MSEFAQAIIAQAVKGDRETSSLISILNPEWIESPHESAIIRTIIDLSVGNKPITAKTISTRIAGVIGADECRKLFTSTGAVVEFVERCNNPDGSKIQAHADQIKLDYTKRTIIASAKRIIDKLPEFQTAEDAASGAVEILASNIDGSIGEGGAYSSEEAARSWLRSVEEQGAFHSWDWVFPTWERRARFRQSEICVFAAPSETGKSLFAGQMLERICRSGNRVALFTGEMTPEEHIGRLVSMGGLSDEQVMGEAGRRRLEQVMSWDFTIYDGLITIDKIRAAVVRARAMGKPYHAVIVDHIHLMEFAGKDGYRIALNNAMTTFKSEIANREKCGVILLAQLRKPEKSEPNRRPRKSDIRESAAIENIADWIFLMARVDEDNVESTLSRIWCEKRRSRGRRFPTIEVEIDDRANRLVEREFIVPQIVM